MHAIDPDTVVEDLEAAPIEALVKLIRAEADLLADSSDKARSVQWTPARPVPSESGQPSNPTANIVADPARLALRLQVIASERVLRDAAVALRGVRLGLDKALAPYGGDPLDQGDDL